MKYSLTRTLNWMLTYEPYVLQLKYGSYLLFIYSCPSVLSWLISQWTACIVSTCINAMSSITRATLRSSTSNIKRMISSRDSERCMWEAAPPSSAAIFCASQYLRVITLGKDQYKKNHKWLGLPLKTKCRPDPLLCHAAHSGPWERIHQSCFNVLNLTSAV